MTCPSQPCNSVLGGTSGDVPLPVRALLANIAGAESSSFLDYPGHLAMVLFFQGCNFDCPWCHNRQLVPFDYPKTQVAGHEGLQGRGEDMEDRIRSWSTLCDAVVLSGGEASCQSDLGDLILWLRSLGLLVKLDTNGSNPQVLESLVKNPETCPDCIAMDIKAPLSGQYTGSMHPYERAAGVPVSVAAIARSIDILAHAAGTGACRVLFRTTRLPWLSDTDLELIRAAVPKGLEWITQPFRAPPD